MCREVFEEGWAAAWTLDPLPAGLPGTGSSSLAPPVGGGARTAGKPRLSEVTEESLPEPRSDCQRTRHIRKLHHSWVFEFRSDCSPAFAELTSICISSTSADFAGLACLATTHVGCALHQAAGQVPTPEGREGVWCSELCRGHICFDSSPLPESNLQSFNWP